LADEFGEARLMRTLPSLINSGGLMRSTSGRENPVSMTDLMDAGVLKIDSVDEDGSILLELDWDALRVYDEEVYLYLREAEMNGEMIQ
jgi:hypothetical protein